MHAKVERIYHFHIFYRSLHLCPLKHVSWPTYIGNFVTYDSYVYCLSYENHMRIICACISNHMSIIHVDGDVGCVQNSMKKNGKFEL